jgi:hypothetical protein
MVARAAPDRRHSRRGSEPGGFRYRRCQPGNHCLEDLTNAASPGCIPGTTAQPGPRTAGFGGLSVQPGGARSPVARTLQHREYEDCVRDGAQARKLPENSAKTRHITGRGRCNGAKIPAKVAAFRGSARLGEARTAGAAQLDQGVKRDSQLPAIARARCLASGVRACACLELDWSVNVDQQVDRSAFSWSRPHLTTPMSA